MTPAQIEHLKKLTEADAKILSLFESDAKEQISEIKEHIHTGNIQDLSLKVHSLKGAAGLFLANDCVDVCKNFENAIKNNSVEKFHSFANSLDHELEKYLDHLQSLRLLH